ncbi:MAG: hypothetical protein ACXWTS_05220 [Methylococcaceae bacterium]
MIETVVLTITDITAFLNDDIWEGETPSDLADNPNHYLYDIEK